MKKIKGKKVTFSVVKRRLPTGRTATIDLVEHPGAGLIVPFLSPDKIIFLYQYRAVLDEYLYELPAGTLEKDEPVLACVKRELMEETGYAGRRFVRLGKIYPVPGYSNEVIYIYKAEGLIPAQAEKDRDEVIQPKVFNRSHVKALFKKGKIVDAKTICGLVMVGWLS